MNQFDLFKQIYESDISHVNLNDFPQLNVLKKKRREEKESLVQLNNQLAKYVQSIEYFEIENKKLILLIEIIQNSIER